MEERWRKLHTGGKLTRMERKREKEREREKKRERKREFLLPLQPHNLFHPKV